MSPSRGTSPPRPTATFPTSTDHAQALAAAGLFDDAEMLARRAIDMLAKDGNEIEMAGALVTAAEIRLAQRDQRVARVAADDAAGWLQKQARQVDDDLHEPRLQAAAR